jgi:hypothetical protein
MDSTKLRIQHQEHDIENVIEFFVKGFKTKAGERITNWDWLYDPHKGRVAFKLYVETREAGSVPKA